MTSEHSHFGVAQTSLWAVYTYALVYIANYYVKKAYSILAAVGSFTFVILTNSICLS